jgi:hypothetical protein
MMNILKSIWDFFVATGVVIVGALVIVGLAAFIGSLFHAVFG